MGVYYPQASVMLRVRWEDFGDTHKESLQKVYDLPILVRNVNVNINDYTQADTFDLEVEYKNFPFDPRSIRACAVTVYMQDMGEFFNSNNTPEQIKPSEENAVFMGFADEESISFDDMKRTVKLEGRDYTGLLIDRKYPHGTINVEKPVDAVISEILASLQETQAIKLDKRIDGDLPALSKFWSEKGKLSNRINVDSNKTYWDVIQDIVSRAGLIAYIELDKLVLTKPRAMYDKTKAKVLIYGRNLKNLEFKRKIGRIKNFNVIVRSLNLATKEVIEAKIPAEASNEWSKETGIANKEVILQTLKPDGTPVDMQKGGSQGQPQVAPYMSFRVPDVSDKPQLIKIGQEIYEEISRQQIEGSAETNEMEIPEGTISKENIIQNQEPFDILKLRVGTPIKIEIDQGDMKGFSRITKIDERKRFLIARGYKPSVAEAFADAMGKYNPIFYTKAVNFSMDADTGFRCKIEFINFIEIPKALAGKQ